MTISQRDRRLEQIEQARSAMLTGKAHPPQPLGQALNGRGWVWQSWQRCLDQGAQPDHSITFEPVSRARYRQTREAHRQLVEVAQPILHNLAKTVAPLHYFVLLADAAGTVLDTAGVDGRYGEHARAIARIGLDLSEQSVGTTAISGALREQTPVWLHRGEHFFHNVGVYSCAGAPVWGPDGHCVGMIDLTGVQVAERPELMHLVLQYARQVEDALVTARPHALQLHLSWQPSWQVAGSGNHGLICADGDGGIVGANRVAGHMLPRLFDASDEGNADWHLKDFFAVPWMELFDLAGSGQSRPIPLWSGLRLQVSAQAADTARQGFAGTRVAHSHAVPTRTLRAVETELIHQAVRKSGGRVDVAAQALGISRATIYRRLRGSRGTSKKA